MNSYFNEIQIQYCHCIYICFHKTALHLAVESKNEEIIKELLKQEKIDLSIRDKV